MSVCRLVSLLAGIGGLWGSLPAAAEVVGGGGSTKLDCLVVLDAAVNAPLARPRHVRCVDGDPDCDQDAVANGACEFGVSVCANSAFDPGCTLRGVQSIDVLHSQDNGDPRFDPDFQSLQSRVDEEIELPTDDPDVCAGPATFRVAVKGPLGAGNRCSPQSKTVKLTSLSKVIDGRVRKDRDKMKLTCLPDPGACDPQTLFAGTFDRIQRQIFDQSCATSGCHDSQSMTGGLLLETGAAYGNLVGRSPTNGAALEAGWLRVDVSSGMGDPSTSLLYRKITGDLPDVGLGERMPFGGRKLHGTLREIVRLWIEAGAPAEGWVLGTD